MKPLNCEILLCHDYAQVSIFNILKRESLVSISNWEQKPFSEKNDYFGLCVIRRVGGGRRRGDSYEFSIIRVIIVGKKL